MPTALNRPAAGDSLPTAGIKLLLSGAISSLTLGVILVGILWFTTDQHRALSAAIGVGMGLVAMGLGQAALAGAWKLSGLTTLAVAMGAYAVAIAAVIAGLVWIDAQEGLSVFWVGIGVVVAAFAYILAVALTYPRLRILLYTPDDPKQESS